MSQPIEYPSSSVRFALPFLFAGQAQKELFVNQALAKIDALLHPAVIAEQADPPAAPADGDAYLIAAGATGDWAGQVGSLTVWQGDQWLYLVPQAGMTVRDLSQGQLLIFASSWQRLASIAGPSGGATIDIEARATIESIISALESYGILSGNRS